MLPDDSLQGQAAAVLSAPPLVNEVAPLPELLAELDRARTIAAAAAPALALT